MSLFDVFRKKPKMCTSCGNVSPGLHQVYSGLRDGALTDQLCTNCLVPRLGQHIRGKSILWVEPLTSDGYTFIPLSELSKYGLAGTRASLALASLGATCTKCSSPPHHLWMPQDDLDTEAMESQPPTDYFSIPAEPADWKGELALCNEHILSHFRDYIEEQRFYFLTFRFPDSSNRGCYW